MINSSSFARVTQTNDTCAMNSPQNARKSIRSSTVTRASVSSSNLMNLPIIKTENPPQKQTTIDVVQNKCTLEPASTEENSITNGSLTHPKSNQVHSARKRRIIVSGPASKKLIYQKEDSGEFFSISSHIVTFLFCSLY